MNHLFLLQFEISNQGIFLLFFLTLKSRHNFHSLVPSEETEKRQSLKLRQAEKKTGNKMPGGTKAKHHNPKGKHIKALVESMGPKEGYGINF